MTRKGRHPEAISTATSQRISALGVSDRGRERADDDTDRRKD
jgi:hypothetical protein